MELAAAAIPEAIFTVVDVETTGLEPEDRVIEVAAVRIRGTDEIGRFQSLVNPGVHIPPLASSISGIDDAMVAGAPPFAEVWPALDALLAGAVLVAHNAPFDLSFLGSERRRAGLPTATGPVLDTLRLARNLLVLPRYSLAALIDALRLGAPPEHRALADALATAALLRRLIETLGPGAKIVADLLQAQEPVPIGWEQAAAAGLGGTLLEPLHGAALEGRWLELAYDGRHGPQRLVVRVLGLEHNGPLYYVRALRLGPAQEPASLRLDRIREVLSAQGD